MPQVMLRKVAESARCASCVYCGDHRVAPSPQQVRHSTTVLCNMEGTSKQRSGSDGRGPPAVRRERKDRHADRDKNAGQDSSLHVNPRQNALLRRQEKPKLMVGGNRVEWQCNNVNLYSTLFLAKHRRAITVVLCHEVETTEDRLGDGQATSKMPDEKYDVISNATRQELYVKLA